MSEMSSAGRLRLGQANIDRMKREVEETVSMVLGVVSRDPMFFPYAPPEQRHLHEDRVFENAEFQWTIRLRSGRPSAECWYKSFIGAGRSVALVYSMGDSRFPSLEDVRLEHRACDFLVDSVLENTRIAKALRPILEAADYQF